jgi:hypothetical protein
MIVEVEEGQFVWTVRSRRGNYIVGISPDKEQAQKDAISAMTQEVTGLTDWE